MTDVADQARTDRPVQKDEPPAGAERFRSAAQLNMLHSLAAKLGALGSIEAIGEAITAELHTIVDYHNCRVYHLQPDGRTLHPVAFRGEHFSEYEEETLEELVTDVGEGMTGWVAETGRSLLTPNAQEVEFAVQIEGTDDIVESMLLVPTKLGDRVNGVIVLSSLGYGRFDEQDLQVLEVLAPHAASAFENASLLAAEREAARSSAALLELSQTLVGRHTVGDILQEAIETIPSLMPCAAVGAYVRDVETGSFRVARLHAVEPRARPIARRDRRRAGRGGRVVPVLRSGTLHDRCGDGRAGPPRSLARARTPSGARRAAPLGARRVRGDRDDRARCGRELRSPRDPHGPGHHEYRLAGAGEREPLVGAGAVPGVGRQPRRRLLGSRRLDARVQLPRRPRGRPPRPRCRHVARARTELGRARRSGGPQPRP